MNPIKLSENKILIKKPYNLIKKKCLLTKQFRKIIQLLDAEQKPFLKTSLEKKWKNCFKI
jgi:hypothetical protein